MHELCVWLSHIDVSNTKHVGLPLYMTCNKFADCTQGIDDQETTVNLSACILHGATAICSNMHVCVSVCSLLPLSSSQ